MGSTLETITFERLAASSVPVRTPADDESRERRHWIVRLAGDVRPEWNQEQSSVTLTRAAAAAVAAARSRRGLAPLPLHGPFVNLSPMGSRHIVVSVETVRLESDDAHEYLVAGAAALQALDREAPIEEIQGIPRSFWSHLLAKPAAFPIGED